jgi:AcrR family transcriptional regulator
MSEKKKPKFHRNKEGKIKRIVESFLRLLNQYDYNDISTNKIAEEAGVSIGTLYNYFDNKEDILQHIFDGITEDFVDMGDIMKIIKERDYDTIQKFIGNYLRNHREYYILNKAHDQAMGASQEIFNSFQDNIKGYIESFMKTAKTMGINLGTTPKEEFTKAFLVGLNIIDTQVHIHLFRKPIFNDDNELIDYLTKMFIFTLDMYLE